MTENMIFVKYFLCILEIFLKTIFQKDTRLLSDGREGKISLFKSCLQILVLLGPSLLKSFVNREEAIGSKSKGII